MESDSGEKILELQGKLSVHRDQIFMVGGKKMEQLIRD